MLKIDTIKTYFKKFNLTKNKVVYEKYSIGDNSIYNDEKSILVKTNRTYLSTNNVPINKIRFVFQEIFYYSIDDNIINPKYDLLLPINKYSGELLCDETPIELNKPQNVAMIWVRPYCSTNNYNFLKDLLLIANKGIVIYINNLVSVNDDVIYVSFLDDEIKNYFNK